MMRPLVVLSIPLVVSLAHLCWAVTIEEIQRGFVPEGTAVTLENVTVTAVDHKPPTFGFFLEEAPGPYHGIRVYTAYTFPEVEPGYMVNLGGTYQEIPPGNGMSEIYCPSVSWTAIDTAQAPVPTLVSIGELGRWPSDSTVCEEWEGVFVRVDSVAVVSVLPYNEFQVVEAHNHPPASTEDTLTVDDKLMGFSLPSVGDTIASMEGVFAFENESYRLWATDFCWPSPCYLHLVVAYATSDTCVHAVFDRPLDGLTTVDPSDFWLASGTEITSATVDSLDPRVVVLATADQTPAAEETLFVCCIVTQSGCAVQDTQHFVFRGAITPIWMIQTPSGPGNDSQFSGEQVTTTGIATGVFGFSFFLEDPPGGPWSGIMVYGYEGAISLGDSIILAGRVHEYYGMTELTSIDYFHLCIGGNVVPGPDIVSPGMIRTGSLTAEFYEAVLVRMDSVEVFSLRDVYGEWLVGLDVDTVVVGAYGDYSCNPGVGSIINVTGCLRYSYGSFKIEPRFDDDIEVVSPCLAGIPRRKSLYMHLYPGAPSYFDSGSSIRFTLPRKMDIRLAVYDISGRLIRLIAENWLTPGDHIIQWDTRDSHGRRLSPGIYFVRLQAGDQVATRKVVLIR